MKRIVLVALAAALTASAQAVTPRVGIADGDVSLQGPLAKTFEAMYRNHVLEQDPVYLTECFKHRTETGLWQTEFWGKYMHSAAPFWSMTKDPVLKRKLDAGIANLLSAQQADGYLGNYIESRRSAHGTWDVWGIKYTMMGLLHYYDATGDAKSMASCRRLCDYLIGSVGPDSKLKIGGTGNYSGMPSCSVLEPVMWLYRRTKEQKYLDFAAFIVKEMTERKDGPRLLELASCPVANRSPAPAPNSFWQDFIKSRNKAYEMMSCYQGLLEYYEVTGRKDLLSATIATVASIVRDEINLAGSAASHEFWFHGAEHQHEPYSALQETCVTITWMRLCEKLLAITGDPSYAEEFEKTFYNAYLASLNHDGSLFAAYTPLTGYRSEGHLHCRMHTNCCNANGPRGFLAFLRSILQAKNDEVFMNWYASGYASVLVPSLGKKACFEVHTTYPRDGKVDIRFRLDKPMKFKFSVRIPGCTANNRMTVNGCAVEARYLVGPRYTMHERLWKPGDVVTLDFGLPVKAHVSHDHVAFTRGPVLLARDSRFGDGDISAELRRYGFNFDRLPAFTLEQPERPDEMRMIVSAALPIGGHAENPEGRRPARIRFCDYASAGNLWRPGNSYRTFIPLDFDEEAMAARWRKAEKPAKRMDRSRLNIGTYCLKPYARTEAHIKDIADCGIDFVIENLDRKTLDLCLKHKVGVILGGVTPGWWGGGSYERNGHMHEYNPIWKYENAARQFKDHPAVWAIDIGDEPSALDFPHYGEVVRCTAENFPNQFPYLNLFPNYALPGKDGQDLSKTQLGCKDYRTHIEIYCKNVPLDYICYDHYLWGWKNKVPGMFENLRIVADACTATHRSLWIVLQANQYAEGSRKNRAMTVNTLRYQANTALAYGAEVISWACWTKGWWAQNAVDTNGMKTATYDMLKTVNAELHRISPQYMKYRRINTDLVGFNAAEFAGKVAQPVLAASTGVGFADVKATDGAALAVGHFASRDGSGGYATYVAACDDSEDVAPRTHVIVFRPVSATSIVKAFDGNGAVAVEKRADGTMSVPLKSNAGVLVVAE